MATRGRPRRSVSPSSGHINHLRETIESEAEQPAVKDRARIVLACLQGASNKKVAASFGTGEHTVSKWRTRFLSAGIDGLRDKQRSGAPKVISDRVLDRLAEIGTQLPENRPGAGTAASLFGVSRSTVARVWKHARENAVPATPRIEASSGEIRLEIVGIYFDRSLKVVAVSPQERLSGPGLTEVTRSLPASETRMPPEVVGTLLVAVARVAATTRLNKGTDSILAFVDEMRAVSRGCAVHLLCFGERASWVEHVMPSADSRGAMKAYSFDDVSPWQETFERALREHMEADRVSRELIVPPALLATMRDYMSGDDTLPPSACFSWSPRPSGNGTPSRVKHSDRRDTVARAKDDEQGGRGKDVELAFYMAPVGLLISRQRIVDKYNQAFCGMFGYAMDGLAGKSLELLYPSRDEFDHVGERALVLMRDTGLYSDERIMRRVDDSLFWCHVSGRAIDRSDPFAAAVWTFEDLSSVRPVTTDLTTRERQIAQFLVNGKSGKQVAKDLNISHRTVEAHRARLMRKYGVGTTSELIAYLIGRRSE
ncbi:helix-turn-helix domain-containing protein [Paraburkholderia phytofirmans]